MSSNPEPIVTSQQQCKIQIYYLYRYKNICMSSVMNINCFSASKMFPCQKKKHKISHTQKKKTGEKVFVAYVAMVSPQQLFYQQNHGDQSTNVPIQWKQRVGGQGGICNLKPSHIMINNSAPSHTSVCLCTEHRSTYGPTVCYKAAIGILFSKLLFAS